MSSTLGPAEHSAAVSNPARAQLQRWLPVAPWLFCVLLLGALLLRQRSLKGRNPGRCRAAEPAGSPDLIDPDEADPAALTRGSFSVLIEQVEDPLLASTWLVERMGRSWRGSPTRLLRRLRADPRLLIAGISATSARALSAAGSDQGLRLRPIWGAPAPSQKRLDELNATTLLVAAATHLMLVGGLGWLGLVMGARLEQLLLLPVGVGLALVPVLRRRSRHPLLKLRRPGLRP